MMLSKTKPDKAPNLSPVSKTVEWRTPPTIFRRLDDEFHFDLDPCASPSGARLCRENFTKDDDGLSKDWGGKTVFVNPPYGKPIKDWVKKSWGEAIKGATVVLLLPVRTSPAWFHDYVLRGEIRFILGRVKFVGAKHNPQFDSMIVIFRPGRGVSIISGWSR